MNAFSIRDAAAQCPTAPFVATRSAVLSFGEVRRLTEARISELKGRGVARGSRLPHAFVAHNDLESLLTLLALFELEVPAMPLHPRWSQSERARFVGSGDAIPTANAEGSERILAVLPTSGSSGEPRGVLLSRRAFLASAQASAENLGWFPHDRWLLCLPLCHIAGLSIVSRCLLARRALFLGEATELESSGSTLASLVPTQLLRLLEQSVTCPASVRAILVGGAALAPALHQRALLSGYPVLSSYGSTETCSQITTQRLGTRDPSHVGPALAGIEVRVVDRRIQVRGEVLASGFYPDRGMPLDAGGWFTSADLGELTPGGELEILGRSDDVIISGGENVLPGEVEAALVAHPDVVAACVVGLPDPEFGQRVFALVVTRHGAVPGNLDAHLRGQLAGFKVPRGFLQLSALPLGSNGKVDRRVALALAREHDEPPR